MALYIKSRLILSIAIALCLSALYSGIQFGADPILSLPVQLPGGQIVNVRLTVSGSPSAYEIQLLRSERETATIIQVHVERHDKQPFKMASFSVNTMVPKGWIQGIWYPSATAAADGVMTANANRSIDGMAAANYGIPYVGAAGGKMENVFALGLGRQDLSVAISGRPILASYLFQLTAVTERFGTSFDESFYVSTNRSLNWFDTASHYADWVDEMQDYKPFPTGDRAFEPLYDAWYWAKDHVDDRLYLETARLARQAGFGTYLADAGWDSATGEYDKWLTGKTGDYNPPADKFTDFGSTLNEIRVENQLGISLWMQPFAVGRDSARYRETQDMHIHVPLGNTSTLGWVGLTFSPFALLSGRDLETVNLCPRMAPAQDYLKNLFAEMAAKYRPEGYWVDFIDGVSTYCSASHAHDDFLFGDGFKKTLEGIKEAVLSSDSVPVVQFRSKYANLNTKPFANVWQTEDSPGDYDGMRLNSIRLKPFSKGVVFAADQMYWPDSTNEATVAKFIVTSIMIGVPAFGPNLLTSPPSTMDMLTSWLAFYRAHQSELTTGRFSLFGQLQVPNQKIEAGDSTFVYLRNLDFAELPVDGTNIYVVNATDSDHLSGSMRVGGQSYSVKVFDRFLGLETEDLQVHAFPSGVIDINHAVQQGGMLVLSRNVEDR